MTNAEKFLKDETRAEFFEAYKEYIKKRVHLNEEEYAAGENYMETFMQLETTPTLTEDERVILRNIPKEYKTIRRIGNNVQVDTEDKEEFACICAFNHLFQFIKERRRIFN